jgi:hypothetical protein
MSKTKLVPVPATPQQLELFDLFTISQGAGALSKWTRYLIGYDELPKYLFSNTKHLERLTKDDHYEVKLTIQGETFIFRISPGVVQRSGKMSIIAFPGEREEMIARVLRYMAVQKRASILRLPFDEQPQGIGLDFSLREVQRHLIEMGHEHNLSEIDDGLAILAETKITAFYQNARGKLVPESVRLLARYSGYDDYEKNLQSRTVVLNSIESATILRPNYRALNFDRLKRLASPIARRLYELIITRFLNADPNKPEKSFVLVYSELAPFLCIKEQKRKRDTIDRIQRAFKELIDAKILINAHPKNILANNGKSTGRKTIVDVRWEVWLSKQDAQDVFDANVEAFPYGPNAPQQWSDEIKLETRKSRKQSLIKDKSVT